MGNALDKTKIEVIEAQEAEKKSNLGKYLNKHIAPEHLYIVEQIPNLMASCLYHISKPMLVFSSKASDAQLLMEAAGCLVLRNKTCKYIGVHPEGMRLFRVLCQYNMPFYF